MSVPKSVIKIDKSGVKYVSNVERASYTIAELTRAALRDVGKFICRRCNEKAQKLPGLKRSRRVRGSASAFQYWARKIECDLQIGVKHDTWYGVKQELGTSGQPKRAILTSTVQENIAEIVKIESRYLSALENEAEALSLVNEEDYQGGENSE